MSSVGQAAGMIVGGAIGIAFPVVGFALGASIGGAIGGMIDPPKGPNVVGPRLDDLSYQSAAFGVPLAHAYGTVPVLGNVFWLEGDKYKEVGKKTKSGGKGGSKSTTETFTYYATCAISLFVVRDPTQTIKLRRLWVGSNLVYDGTGAAIDSTIASHLGSVNFTFYSGADPQAPHPRMQADKGAANVSGYPGLCYIVLEDLDLTPYSNSLEMAQVKAEVCVAGAEAYVPTFIDDLLYPSPVAFGGARYLGNSSYFTAFGATHWLGVDNNWDGYFYGVQFVEDEFSISQRAIASIEYAQPGSGYLRNPAAFCYAYATDRPVCILTTHVAGYGQIRKMVSITPEGIVVESNEVDSYRLINSSCCVVSGTDVYLMSGPGTSGKISGWPALTIPARRHPGITSVRPEHQKVTFSPFRTMAEPAP